jgi:hypothetical protein
MNDWIVQHLFGGRMPEVARIEPDTEQMVRTVARGEGYAVTTAAHASILSVRGVMFEPFANPVPAAPFGLAWRPAEVAAPLRQRAAIARKLAQH